MVYIFLIAIIVFLVIVVFKRNQELEKIGSRLSFSHHRVKVLEETLDAVLEAKGKPLTEKRLRKEADGKRNMPILVKERGTPVYPAIVRMLPTHSIIVSSARGDFPLQHTHCLFIRV